MSKHTPGPWEVMLGRDKEIRGLRGKHGPVSVNIVNWNGFSRMASENGQANARLIAAAPDLLAALEYACEAEWNGVNQPVWAEAANAAIKKARGQ